MAKKGVSFVFIVCFSVVYGELCSSYSSSAYTSYTRYMYCSTGCCGTTYDRYCCAVAASSVGVIVGAVIGSLVLVAIVVSVIVAVCCCLKKSHGRTGQVMMPATTTMVYGAQTGVPGYAQVQYGNAPYPQQMPTTDLQQTGPGQKWETQPPPYQPANPN